jgi:hypothetical protein
VRWRGGLLATLVLAGSGGAVWAQQSEAGPSPAVECLMPASESRGAPEYPAALLERKDAGTVNVELIFTAPDLPPRVSVTEGSTVFDAFIWAVRSHVAQYRVPCMNDGRKVMSSAPQDRAQAARAGAVRCLTRSDGERTPYYPVDARQAQAQGRYYVESRFTAPDTPPEVTILAGAPSRSLRRSVADFTKGWRMPCLGDSPMTVRTLFIFKLDGGERTLLRDMRLRQFVQTARRAPRPAYFDTNTMGCPFDVRLAYYRPHSSNDVRELDNTNLARRPLLDWISQLELSFPVETNTELLGQEITLTVPCMTIDI